MSLLMFAHDDEGAYVLTDTLATDESGEPYLFVDKCLPVPSMNLLVACTGYGELLVRWMEMIRCRMLARDITMLDLHTPKSLRDIWADLNDEQGRLEGTGTIYHFGIEEKTRRCVRYTYRSYNDFTSERIDDPGFGVKPTPTGRPLQAPDSLDGWVALAEEIKAEQDALPQRERIHIGGDLVLAQISLHRCELTRVHRFPDQINHWQAMNDGEPIEGNARL